MKYFDIPVTVVAQGETLEDAQLNVYKFMPEIPSDSIGKLDNLIIDSWFVNNADNDILDMKMRGLV